MRMVQAGSLPKKGGCQSKKCAHDHGAQKKRAAASDSDDDNDMV